MSEEGEKYRFEYRHFRPRADAVPFLSEYLCERYMRGLTEWTPHECGGVTICFICSDEVEGIVAMGMAFCSMRDNFSYRLGREIALGRAFANLKGALPKRFNGYYLSGPGGDYWLLKKVKRFYVPA